MILFEQIKVDPGPMIVVFTVHKSFGNDLHEIMIACRIFGQQNKMAETFLCLLLETAAPCHVYFTAQNRLYSLLFCRLIQVYETVHIAMIRNSDGRHPFFFRLLHHLGNTRQAVEKAVLGMIM